MFGSGILPDRHTLTLGLILLAGLLGIALKDHPDLPDHNRDIHGCRLMGHLCHSLEFTIRCPQRLSFIYRDCLPFCRLDQPAAHPFE